MHSLTVVVSVMAFYEKVIKVKADVAALVTFLFFVAFATFPEKILR